MPKTAEGASIKGHLHDLRNRLGELQSRIYMGNANKEMSDSCFDKCIEKLDEAVKETQVLAESLFHQTLPGDTPSMKLRHALLKLEQRDKSSMLVHINTSVQEAMEVYGTDKDFALIANELIRNAAKAHASRLTITASDRGLDHFKILFLDNGDGMSKKQCDNLGFGQRKEGHGGHGVALLHELAHKMGGHIYWLPTSQQHGGSYVILTLGKVTPESEVYNGQDALS